MRADAELADSVTQLLVAAHDGREDAWHRIYALLYEDLHRIARSQIRQQIGPHLSPTSLISETWLRLSGSKLAVENRPHLTALIARAMRFVLLDEARRMLADKRGGGAEKANLDDVAEPSAEPRLEQLLVLGQALDGLADIDERLSQVVELRYFGGLSEQEIADVFGLTVRTVRRDWRRARAYLLKQLGEEMGQAAI
ncbi:ECF-type sigma factor [Luteimonas aquatica]|uniref:ECF-type sigma factor n=1 Tax=Luteimonas aquatica TaxID=450364 RepID=UPI001F5A1012|nr:ECF-type sigma factor [Luteimonas aquatica]